MQPPRDENAPPETPNLSRLRAGIWARFLPLPEDASPEIGFMTARGPSPGRCKPCHHLLKDDSDLEFLAKKKVLEG